LEGAARQMLNDASRLAIEQMSVNELMDLMSPPGRARSVKYGSGVPRPGDFAPLPPPDGLRPSTGSTSFRKRTPTPRRLRVK
jgi:hypothetical protein